MILLTNDLSSINIQTRLKEDHYGWPLTKVWLDSLLNSLNEVTVCRRLRIVYGRRCYSQAIRTFIICDRRRLSSFELWHKTSLLLFTKRDTGRLCFLFWNVSQDSCPFYEIWHMKAMLPFSKCDTGRLNFLLWNVTQEVCPIYRTRCDTKKPCFFSQNVT